MSDSLANKQEIAEQLVTRQNPVIHYQTQSHDSGSARQVLRNRDSTDSDVDVEGIDSDQPITPGASDQESMKNAKTEKRQATAPSRIVKTNKSAQHTIEDNSIFDVKHVNYIRSPEMPDIQDYLVLEVEHENVKKPPQKLSDAEKAAEAASIEAKSGPEAEREISLFLEDLGQEMAQMGFGTARPVLVTVNICSDVAIWDNPYRDEFFFDEFAFECELPTPDQGFPVFYRIYHK